MLFLLVYVDDIRTSGNNSALISHTISLLNTSFALKTLGSVNYFLGFKAFRDSNRLYLTQSKYIVDLLKKTSMFDLKPCVTPISSCSKLTKMEGSPLENPTSYRSIIGALQYLCYTRLDLSFSVNKLSQFLVASTQVH